MRSRAGLEVLQLTRRVRSCTEPSSNLPKAWNAAGHQPSSAGGGMIWTSISEAAVTSTEAGAVQPSILPSSVAFPTPRPNTAPGWAGALGADPGPGALETQGT